MCAQVSVCSVVGKLSRIYSKGRLHGKASLALGVCGGQGRLVGHGIEGEPCSS